MRRSDHEFFDACFRWHPLEDALDSFANLKCITWDKFWYTRQIHILFVQVHKMVTRAIQITLRTTDFNATSSVFKSNCKRKVHCGHIVSPCFYLFCGTVLSRTWTKALFSTSTIVQSELLCKLTTPEKWRCKLIWALKKSCFVVFIWEELHTNNPLFVDDATL